MEKRCQLLKTILQYAFYFSLLDAYCEGTFQSQYIGCFYDTSSQVNWNVCTLNSSQMTIELCIQTCNGNGTTYAILQGGRDCLCGNVINASFPISTCQIPCSGNGTEVCGGFDETKTFSVIYTVCPVSYYGSGCDQVCHCKQNMPCNRFDGKCPNGCDNSWSGDTCNKETDVSARYIGCYGDDSEPDRAMPVRLADQNNNTIEFCSGQCASRNYTYAGMQFRWQCFCGETYNRYGPSRGCSEKCSGNQSQYCGGSYANSVYSVCPKGSYGRDCVSQCNCQDGATCNYSTGSCASRNCKPGWSGDSCNNRNCSNQNGACLANEACVTIDLKFSSVNRCQCLSGFQRTRLWDSCTDINECEIGLCDSKTTSSCSNTVGNFSCTCRDGYKPGNKTFCEDIDECLSSPCDNVTICSNTPGSFVCNCKPGFTRSTNESVCTAEITVRPADKGNAGTIAGAVIGSILGLALVVAIVLLALYLFRRHQPEKLVNQNRELEELPSQSQDGDFSLYGQCSPTYEEIGPTTGNALNTLHNKLSNPDGIKQEFQSVELQLKDFCALGTMTEVKKKNRFVNIIPYESNRVVLSRTSDDDISKYINASYIQGYNNTDKFIAAQGPREETLEDFWRMIIENRVHLIVMITNLVENQKNKCEKYWPDLGHPVTYGDVNVTLKSEKTWPDYTLRCIRCSKGSATVELKQLHYLSWPDHGVPSDIKGFLTFRRIVRQRMKPESYAVIHCSAGAGRTGAFIAIDYLIEQEKAEHDIKILDCLKKLRDQRSHMIQNLAQYVFVHHALLLAFEIGDTVIPVTQFASKNKQLQTKDAASGKSTLDKQFQFLCETNIDPEETAKYLVWSTVVAHEKMNEMNAVFVQSWKLKDAYIATQPSDPFSSIWELTKEQSCAVIIYLDRTQGSKELFFPTEGNPKTFGDCTLLCKSMTKEEYGSHYAVSESKEQEDTTYANVGSSDIYQNTAASTSAKTQFTVLHATDVLKKSSWNANRLMALYNAVCSIASKRNDVPILVVSSDCSLSGFCLAAFNAFEMMKQEEMIDIYQIVLNIRKSKTELFNSMPSYIELHNVVERYIAKSTAENYSNS